ncbi:MAG: DNA cytosine methyltransferase [Polyangiaceae bacterium]
MIAIDLFSGAGGFTESAQRAGACVVWAANHWRFAVDLHAANHPGVEHACQDLRQADWSSLPAFDLLLASPACQGHSHASQPGRRPYHDAMRATAWAVVDCAEVTRPAALLVENVLAMRRWTLFPIWRAALERLGYSLSEHETCATDHGVPQRRVRLFIAGVLSGRAVRPPPRSISEPSFGPCIEADVDGWRPIAEAGADSRDRMAAAARRWRRTCLVQHTTGHAGIPLSQPIRTITTKRQWVLVDGDRYRWLTLRELARGMGFPDSYTWPADATLTDVACALGNAVSPPVGEAEVRSVMEAA